MSGVRVPQGPLSIVLPVLTPVSDVMLSVFSVPKSLDVWWRRRQLVTGRLVPSPVGRFYEHWAPFTALVEQFRSDRNHELVLSQIPPAADVYLVWVCTVGHEFVATPAEQRGRAGRSRSTRSWCPVCSTPSLLPSTPRHPRSRTSAVANSQSRLRPARRVARSVDTNASQALTTAPGVAFRSDRASRATSAAEGRLRALIAERLDVDLACTAVRVRTPFFGHLEVWPDIIIPELAIAIELDTVGRNGDEHVGQRERADRRKDQLLADVGWRVVRVRCRPLRPLGPRDVVVAGVSAAAVSAVLERVAEIRGELMVRSYAR